MTDDNPAKENENLKLSKQERCRPNSFAEELSSSLALKVIETTRMRSRMCFQNLAVVIWLCVLPTTAPHAPNSCIVTKLLFSSRVLLFTHLRFASFLVSFERCHDFGSENHKIYEMCN